MGPELLLEDAITFLWRPGIRSVVVCACFYLVWRIFAPGLRKKLLEMTIGIEAAREWPELDELLLPIVAWTKGTVDCQALINYVLVRRPSRTTRALLKAYNLRLGRIVLESQEKRAVGVDFTEEALWVAIQTCINLRASRPTRKTIDHSDLIVTMFGVPSLAAALEHRGLSKLKVRYFLSRLQPLADDEASFGVNIEAEHVWIRIHDDAYSTVDLVNRILTEVFNTDLQAAARITDDVQRYGHASLGPYSPDAAMNLLSKSIAMARAAEAPLMLTLTTENPSAGIAGQERAPQGATASQSRNPYAPPKSKSL